MLHGITGVRGGVRRIPRAASSTPVRRITCRQARSPQRSRFYLARPSLPPASRRLAGLNIAPASLFILGLGALVFGISPRWTTAVVYGYLAWSFLVELLGSVVHASHWVLDTSVYFHMVPAPASSPD